MQLPDLIQCTAPAAGVVVLCAGESVVWGDVQAAEGGGRTFTGTAYTGAAMDLGWGVPVVVDLAGLDVPRQDLPVLRQHDPERIVGHTTSIQKSPQRLKIAGVVSGTGPAADEVKATSAGGFPWQLSIGAARNRVERVDAGQKVNVNGRAFVGPIIVVRAATLRENSFVPLGADGATSAAVAASHGGSPVDFDAFVRAAGLDPATLTDAQRAWFTAQHAAATPPPNPGANPPGDPLEAAARDARAERTRRDTITATAARLMKQDPTQTDAIEKAARLAIDGGLTVQAAELQLLTLSYGRGPAMAVRTAPAVTDDVLSAALCRGIGLDGYDKAFDARTLEAVDSRFKGGAGLHEVIDLCAEANGYHGRGVRHDLTGTIKAALDIRAGVGGPSTLSLPTALGNAANKFVMVGFDSVDQAWRSIAAIGSVRDFKQKTTVGLTGDMVAEKLAPSGEIKHGTVGEQVYTNQADTEAKMLGIDRREIINDDAGVLGTAGKRLGRGQALRLNNKFWGKFLNNGAFFTSGRGNAATGAGTALGVDSLTAAKVLFGSQTDPDGQPLGAAPRILLVPLGLEDTAMRLMGSMGLILGGTAGTITERGDMNPHRGTLRVVSTPYLSNSTFTGYSATAWYVLADPNDIPVIEVVFLNGNQRPTLETSDMEFNQLGIVMRTFWDNGVEFVEYRGGNRQAGA